ncbi:Protein of unknown function [Pyronema omphalodes CBS 100304]|uniref:Uncharacterized protein n=1 Tax=Pyronema omphalodes (strain CBS 100304) TaxID=1076935 RepID=U4LSR4_PYROM|nr:Protein of unknown function [Pyronema omphalodes CBS 100304]
MGSYLYNSWSFHGKNVSRMHRRMRTFPTLGIEDRRRVCVALG